MSTASPLPLPTMPQTSFEQEALERRQEIAARLLEHRKRRPNAAEQAGLPALDRPARTSRVADSVAARFAKSQSYRDFLAEEAECAMRAAEAAAEVARRNADAVSDAQQRLLQEIDHWNRNEETDHWHRNENTPARAELLAPAISAQEISASEILIPEILPPTVVATSAQAGYTQPDSRVSAAPPVSIEAPAEPEHPIAPWRIALASEDPREPAVPIPGNLLEFPRQLIAARKARPRFAEGPLREEADSSPERAQLRIFEVDARSVLPEPAVETVQPEWASIRLEGSSPQWDSAAAGVDTSLAPPIESAPLSRRCLAAVADGCCIASACLLAVIAAAYVFPQEPTGVPAAIAVSGLLLTMTLLYQLLFFSLSDATPGMRFARIGLCTFTDENPTRRAMRRRIFALVLATLPIGLGIVWAWLDDEGLGWHDRISRMYQRAY